MQCSLLHVVDCTHFYHCEHAANGGVQARHKACALMVDGNRLHFNDKIKICDWPSAAGLCLKIQESGAKSPD
jgi:hypothetical protein